MEETVTKFNFRVSPEDADTFRAKSDALGWAPAKLARKLVEEFNQGNFKLSQSAHNKNLLKDIYK